MDTTNSIFDWLDSNPDLKQFNVPLMSDRDAEISRAFGVIQRGYSDGQMMSGFPANSVFIVDSEDRVRHHTVLDPRVGWNIDEVARLVAAFRSTDGGQVLAMAGWEGEEDTVDNQIPAIAHFYATVYGDEEDAEENTTTNNNNNTDMQTRGKPAGHHQRVGFGGDQQSFERASSTSRAGLSGVSRSKSDKCSDCPDRNCLNCPLKRKGSDRSKCSDCPDRNCLNCPIKKKGCKSKCADCSVNCKGSDKCSDCPDRNCPNCPLKKNCKGSDIKGKESWWALKPFSLWPATNQQQGEEKEVAEEDIKGKMDKKDSDIKGKMDKKKEDEGGKPAWWA